MYGLQNGALAHTKQQARKGPKNIQVWNLLLDENSIQSVK